MAALAVAVAAPSGALAQGGSPFQPLPPAPQEVPEESLPTDTSSTQDDDFSAIEWLLLGGVATALLGGVAWAIAREGGGFQRGRRRRRDARAAGAGAAKPRKPAASSGGSPSGGRGEAKPPPPPPRKRRAASAKKRAGKARPKAKRR